MPWSRQHHLEPITLLWETGIMNKGGWLGMQEGVVSLSQLGRLLGSTLCTQ